MMKFPIIASLLNLLVASSISSVTSVRGQLLQEEQKEKQTLFLDNRETCSHRVINCDPDVDHFETKIKMDHSSSVKRLDYENTYIVLEQSWPTRGPWMKNTTQKVILVRCGCPVPSSSQLLSGATIIHIPVSSVMVQMPNTLSKLYLMGQRSKVTSIESNKYISDGTPEIVTDIRDGIIRRLDLSPNGIPSTRVTVSFTNGRFVDDSTGFRLELIDTTKSDDGESVLGETDCIFPTTEPDIETILDSAFNSIPDWVDAGNVWVLVSGEADAEPSTTLSYTLYFDNQLSMDLELRGSACGGGSSDIEIQIERDYAPNNRPIYHRLHDLPGGFPDVLITEPRSLGPLAVNDPKILARQFIDADPGEETPLGRAELMKLIALLVGSVETGNALFETIEARYNDVKALADQATYRPTVMVGKPGTWNEAARNSWMITVGSTYVGQLLRDANAEYRNSDDSIQASLCGTNSCGVCPSGTTDTRCSIAIDDYLNLFRSTDYWIAAGVGANCWSASCNFDLTADELLDQNREIFSQFAPMQCNSVIGLDQDGDGGATYWDMGRQRPDLVLQDLVALLHPDLQIQNNYETTFFRMLPPLSNTTGMLSCPRTSSLPATPEIGTVHVTSIFDVELSDPPDDLIGAPRFTVLDSLYPTVHEDIAEALGVDTDDLVLAVGNNNNNNKYDDSVGAITTFPLTVTIRVSDCSDDDHSCGIEVGEKLDSHGSEIIETAIDMPWVSVTKSNGEGLKPSATLVLDSDLDIIPLDALLNDNNNNNPVVVASSTADGSSSSSCTASGGTTVGIVIGVLVAVAIAAWVSYKVAYAQGVKDTLSSYANNDGNDEQNDEFNDNKVGSFE